MRKYGVLNLRSGSERILYRMAEAPKIDNAPGAIGMKVSATSKEVGSVMMLPRFAECCRGLLKLNVVSDSVWVTMGTMYVVECTHETQPVCS